MNAPLIIIVVIVVIVGMIMLSRSGSQRKKEAIADLQREKDSLHTPDILELVSQEVSEAQPTVTSDISSPSIFNRQITTSLSVKDGGSVLLGGLISRSESEGTSGVPILSRIPLLGKLFRVDSKNSIRTELIVMIVPYVIADAREAEEITATLKGRLGFVDESGIK